MKRKKTKQSDRVLLRNLRKSFDYQANELISVRAVCENRMREIRNMEMSADGHKNRRLALYDSLMIERLDLMGRLARIDQRIQVLGMEPRGVTSQMGLDSDVHSSSSNSSNREPR